jgi:beta-lactamase regulating signal transducer with metallopeptidase domain
MMNEPAFSPWMFFANDVSVRWVLALMHFIWQGAAAGLLVVLCDRASWDNSARLRYSLHSIALLALPICVAVTFSQIVVPESLRQSHATNGMARITNEVSGSSGPSKVADVPTPPNALGTMESPTLANGNAALVQSPDVLTPSVDQTFVPGTPSSPDKGWATAFGWFSIAYLLGVFGFSMRLSIALWGGQRMRNAASRLADPELLKVIADQAVKVGLRIVPVVAYCERVAVPTVVGLVKPMVLLPATILTSLSPNEVAAIITHEFVHIRRYDLWMNLAQRIIESLLFFHPVVWYISRRISQERELCCDDLVVSLGNEPLSYAGALLRMAELCIMVKKSDLATLAAGGHSQAELERRIKRLMNFKSQSKFRLTRVGFMILMALILSGVATPAMLSALAQSTQLKSEELGSMDSDKYRAMALPNEEFVLKITKGIASGQTDLHEERLKLKPGEVLDRTIDLTKTVALNEEGGDDPTGIRLGKPVADVAVHDETEDADSKQLASIDTDPIAICQKRIKELDEAGKTVLACKARERLANRLAIISKQAVESFTRPAPKGDANLNFGGERIDVQVALDGHWSTGIGNAAAWQDWITRKQGEYSRLRMQILFEAGQGFRKQVELVAAQRVLQSGLAGNAIYDQPIAQLIQNNWPVKSDKPPEGFFGTGHFAGPYAAPHAWTLINYLSELAQVQQDLRDVEHAKETQSRHMLACFMMSWTEPSAAPTQSAWRLWNMLRDNPQTLPPLFWFNVLEPNSASVKFDLTDAKEPRNSLRFHGQNVVATPAYDFDQLAITAEFHSKSGIIDIYTIPPTGKQPISLGSMMPKSDGAVDQTITELIKVPAGTGLIQFRLGGEGVRVGLVSVEATFK